MKFQIETPSDQDLFHGKPHETTALAIAETLKSQPQISLIGLEGDLGSGKSTIINLVKSELGSSNYIFSTFDVEKYHYSSTHSSFIKFLNSELSPLIDANDEDKKKKIQLVTDKALGNLLDYRKQTDTQLSPLVFLFAICVVLCIRYVDIPMNILLDYLLNGKEDKLIAALKTNAVKSLLGLSPFLLMISTYILSRVPKLNFKFRGIGNLLNKNGTDTITEKFNVNRDVGATELLDAVSEYLTLIPNDKTFILIIDNLDRVDSEKVKEVWSDLEIFTKFCGDKFRIILPFSSKHISNALSQGGIEGHEFISKRLPVVFRSPPILSAGWRSQFEAYWEETLPYVDGVHTCAELLEIWRSESSPITPRVLKRYINDIAVALATSHHKNISSIVYAAYVNACRYRSIPLSEFLSRTNEKEKDPRYKTTYKYLDMLGEDKWPEHMSSIHYQAPKDIAQSELLDKPIIDLLFHTKGKELLDLSKVFGFDVHFERIMMETNITLLYSMVYAISSLEGEGDKWLRHWLPLIDNRARAYTDYEYLDADYVNAVHSLQKDRNICVESKPIWGAIDFHEKKVLSDKGDSGNIVDLYLFSRLLNYTPSFVSHPKISFFYKKIWPHEPMLKIWELENVVKRLTNVEKHELIRLINLDNGKLLHLDKLLNILIKEKTVSKDSVMDGYEGEIKLSKVSDETLKLIPFMSWFNNPKSIHEFITKVKNEVGGSDNPKHWIALLVLYAINTDSLSSRYAGDINFDSKVLHTTRIIDIIEGLVSEYGDVEEELKLYSPFICDIYQIMKALSVEELSHYAGVLMNHLIFEDKVEWVEINNIIINYLSYKSLISSSPKLLEWMATWSKDADIELDSYHFDFIDDVFKFDNEIWKANFYSKLDEYGLEANNWHDYISSRETRELENISTLLRYLKGENRTLSSSDNAYKAINEYVVATENGVSHIPESNFEKITNLFDCMDARFRGKIIRRIERELINTHSGIDHLYQLIAIFGSYIKMPASLTEPERKHFIYLLENAGDDDVVEWLGNQEWGLENFSDEEIGNINKILGSLPSDLLKGLNRQMMIPRDIYNPHSSPFRVAKSRKPEVEDNNS